MIDVQDGVPGVNADDPISFEEFWPYYLSQHLHPVTRLVHAVGTSAALAVGLVGLLRRRPLTVLGAPLLAYGPAFASHFIWEKNRPATLGGHVLWSARSDLMMLQRIVTGRIGDDIDVIREALEMEPGQVTLADLDRDRGVTRSMEIPGTMQVRPSPAGIRAE